MLKLPSLSLARAMALIIFIAIDLALLRQLAYGQGSARFYASGTLVMSNVLAIGLLQIATRPASRTPFLVGFLAVGLVAMVAYMTLVWAAPVWSSPYHITLLNPVDGFILRACRLIQSTLDEKFPPRSVYGRAALACVGVPAHLLRAVLLALPQLVLAICGGCVTWCSVGIRSSTISPSI